MKFAIVYSGYYKEIADGLLQGTKEVLAEKGIEFSHEDLFPAPGAFEIPLIAQKLAEKGTYSGVICLGCVIKGDTYHFEAICNGLSQGLMSATLKTSVPIAFGVLTVYEEEQALLRSRPGAHNKGREAALACVESAQTLSKIVQL